MDTAIGAVWRIVELRRTNPYLGPVVELERHNAGRARVSVSAEQLIHDGARAQVARWRSLAESPPGGAA